MRNIFTRTAIKSDNEKALRYLDNRQLLFFSLEVVKSVKSLGVIPHMDARLRDAILDRGMVVPSFDETLRLAGITASEAEDIIPHSLALAVCTACACVYCACRYPESGEYNAAHYSSNVVVYVGSIVLVAAPHLLDQRYDWIDKLYWAARHSTSNTFPPAWRTLDTTRIAKDIFHNGNMDFPILADALNDAGCDDEVLLQRLRQERDVWFRGEWAVHNLVEN